MKIKHKTCSKYIIDIIDKIFNNIEYNELDEFVQERRLLLDWDITKENVFLICYLQYMDYKYPF